MPTQCGLNSKQGTATSDKQIMMSQNVPILIPQERNKEDRFFKNLTTFK